MAIEIQAMGDAMYEQPDLSGEAAPIETQETTTTDTHGLEKQPEGQEVEKEVSTEQEPQAEAKGTTDAKGGIDKESAESESKEPTYFFGETEVTVDIPNDIRKEMSEKGIDVDDLVSQLYSKDSDFTLREDTYDKLCASFGKFSVDTYLSSLKMQNETFLSNLEREQLEKAKADEARYNEVIDMVGGEDVWVSMEEYALANLSDEELAQVNQIMESGNSFAQNLAVMDLQNRMKNHNGDSKVDLLDATPVVDTSNEIDSPLERDEYMKLTSELATKYRHDPESYAKEQSKLDARRRKALSK